VRTQAQNLGRPPSDEADEPRDVLRELYPIEPFSDAAGELGPEERELVERALSDPEVCRTRTAAAARWSAYHRAAGQGSDLPSVEDMADALRRTEVECEFSDACWDRERLERLTASEVPSIEDEVVEAALAGRVNLGRMAALPSIEDMAEALRQPEAKCEFADARWVSERLERLAARKEASQQVEHRWVNGRWQRRQSPAEFAATRLPAARARERRAAVALAARRRSTCTEGPTRARARTRARGAGRPGHRRVARALAPPGGEASEGEPAKRPAPADDDVDLTATLA
jgi:hypothetical protein